MAIGIFSVIVVGASGRFMENFGGIRAMYTLLGMIALKSWIWQPQSG